MESDARGQSARFDASGLPENYFDIIIVGAGIAGCTVARELSRYDLRILVLERGFDVACGATRTNSGILHGGFDPEPGTVKAHFNRLGREMFPDVARELGFRYHNNTSLVVAFCEEDRVHLQELYERGRLNGTPGLELIDQARLRELEPNVSPEAVGALWCRCSGITDPFGMCVAYAENAATNGVTFRFEEPVTGIEPHPYGAVRFTVQTSKATYVARTLVNCAGVHADEVAALAGDDTLSIKAVAGEYYLLDREVGASFGATMFQVPTAAGKGVLVTPTVEGNILVGPNAVPKASKDDTSTGANTLAQMVQSAKKTWPALPERMIISNFAGLRPKEARHDFVVGPSPCVDDLYHVAGFESPGLTCAPAVALDMATRIARWMQASPNPHFVATRPEPGRFIEMSREERAARIKRDPSFSEIVCRCEQVTKAEILEAIHAPIPAHAIDAVRRRTRVGTGRCQGSFCTPLIAEIIADETGVSVSEVCRTSAETRIGPCKRRGER